MKRETLTSPMVLLAVAVVGITLSICCSDSFAGQTAWRGTVIDTRTGQPVSGIILYAGKKGRVDLGKDISAADGTFTAKYPVKSSTYIAEKGLKYYLYVRRNPKTQPYLAQIYQMRPLQEHITVELMPYNVYIKGRLVDEATGKPIAGATVTVLAPGRSVVSAKTSPDGTFAFKPLPGFHRLSPYYAGTNAVPKAYRVASQPLLKPISYSIAVRAKGYQSLNPVENRGKKPREFKQNLPLVTSATDSIYTWVDVRMPKATQRGVMDISKHLVAKVKGQKARPGQPNTSSGKPNIRNPKMRPPNTKPTSSGRVVDVWNRSACKHTNTVTFVLPKPTAVQKIVIWHDWKPSEKALPYTLYLGNRAIKKGKFAHGASDTYQKNWAEGIIAIDAALPAGTYKIKVPTGRAAINSAAPNGFVRVFTLAGKAAPRAKPKTPTMPKRSRRPKRAARPKKATPTSPGRPPVDIPGGLNSPAVAMDYSHEKLRVATQDTADEVVDKTGKVVRDPGGFRTKQGIVKVYYADEDYYMKTRRKRRTSPPPKPFTGLLTSGKWDCPLQNGRKHGVQTTWYVDNPNNGVDPKRLRVFWNATWRNGIEHGLYKQNHKNGKLSSRSTYQNGVQQGPAYTFYDTGKLKREWTYKNGKIHGVLRIYGRDGKLQEEFMYHEGKRQ